MTDYYKIREIWRDRVAHDPRLSPLAFRVAYVLSNYINRETGEAWPSQATLGAEVGVKERAMRDALTALKAAGYLFVNEGRGRGISSRYRLLTPENSEPENRHQRATLRLVKPAPTSRFSEDKTGTVTHENRHGDAEKTGTAVPPILMKDTNEDTRPASPPLRAIMPENIRTVLFRDGLAIVRQMTGKTESGARSMIGGWLKTVRDDAKRVMRALEDARDADVADLPAWMSRALRYRNGQVDALSPNFIWERH